MRSLRSLYCLRPQLMLNVGRTIRHSGIAMRHLLFRLVPIGIIASSLALAGCRGAATIRSPQAGSAPIDRRLAHGTAYALCLDFTRDSAALRSSVGRLLVLFDSVPARDTLQYGLNLLAEWWRDTTDRIPAAIGAWSGNPIGGKYQPTYAVYTRTDSAQVMMGINVVDGRLVALARVYPSHATSGSGNDQPLLHGTPQRCRRSPYAA